MLTRCMVARDEPLRAIQEEPEIDEEHLQMVQDPLASMGTRASKSSALPVPDAPATLPGHVLLESLWQLIKRGEKSSNQRGVRSEKRYVRVERSLEPAVKLVCPYARTATSGCMVHRLVGTTIMPCM